MDIPAIQAEYKKKVEEIRAFRNVAFKKIEDEMVGVFREFFAKYPEVTCIWWTQFTPYFNDGDICEWSMRELIISDTPISSLSSRGSYWDMRNLLDRVGPNTKSYKDFSNLLYSLDEIWHDLYGDHVSILVTPKNIIIEKWDHD